MRMPTQKQQHTLQLYADLMEEVKHRNRSVTETLRNKSGHPGPIVREFCYLQLRMLCELIALSCLVAHGDIQLPRQLRKAYAADDMLKQLEALHPNYYP